MDFRFTEEQEMTASVVRDLLADLCQPADLRRLMEAGEARDNARWDKIVEMGLAGILVPEHAGGLGLGAVDFVQCAEACGYAGLPEPLVENAGVALPLLAGASPAHPLLARALEGEITVAVGHGANPFVADADTAGAIVVERDGELHLIEADSASLTRQPSIDPFRRLFTVDFAASEATRIASAGEAAPLLAQAFDQGALFAAAQLLGIAQRCVDLAVDYAKERQQFGKPIGSYQAIKHHLATVQVKIEFARPVLHAAAAMLPQRDLYSRARISHAKLVAAEAADLAARTAIQVHGAMGYSWEVDVHFFLKRAIALDTWWGAPALHRGRVAARVLGGQLGPDSTFCKEQEHA
ncbi:acyl-CoA dehydrogenase family protein [Aquamicrobium sp. LC103]|uniref:acyl-CoA dehydrogenase family protein n=1 Tax=Aquamicrobium sp. LC103 TaxID=1120658 RepID=UPI00063ECF50|nr:acyl-CoA dehydrogenase family protein [Aquamicrobium sp. LC103]TKT75766.1 acyl-CoA dehydrogenase [Aquamicrobium sp. LC103]